MKTMGRMFMEGSKCIWVAPSGGRDRRDSSSGAYVVADFDAKSVEMFRFMAGKSGRRVHFYPLSLLTHTVCPPPKEVGGAIGEQRVVKYAPAGVYFGDEVDLDKFPPGCTSSSTENRDRLRQEFAAHMHSLVTQNYERLAAELRPWLRGN